MGSGRVQARIGWRQLLVTGGILAALLLIAPPSHLALILGALLGGFCAAIGLRAFGRLARKGGFRWRPSWQGWRPLARRNVGFHSLPVALLRFDANGRITAANRAARQMAGLEHPLPFAHDLFEDLGRPIADWLRDVASGRQPAGTEVLRMRGRDAENFIQLSLQAIDSNTVLGIVQDATALKRLEAQFTQSQKMQAVGQLAGGISHDFNNLLTAITGHCELLLLRHRPGDADHSDLLQIQQNAFRAAALVKQLLAFSRKQTLVPEVFDLREVLAEMTHLLGRLLGGTVQLDLHQPPAAVAIRADRRQFEQVILNLAVNARDAMPAGGKLRIKLEETELTAPLKRGGVSLAPGRYARIALSDTGTGISPDHLDKIFEPFFTTKRAGEGTGLGLSTVYGIVKQSGGYVFVESQLGAGTRFDLWFPALDMVPARAPGPALPQRAGATEGVVLLVEDELPVRAFAARALRMRGLTVLEAASGEEALDTLADPDLRVDLLVSDVFLPGLDGPGWVERALASRPGTPVIFTSGYAADGPAEAQGRIPGSSFLSKPFTLAELSQAVTARLSGQRGPSPSRETIAS